MRYRLLLSTGLALVAGLGLLLFFLLTYRQADVAGVLLLAVQCAGLWLLLRYLVKEKAERQFLWRILLITILLRFSLCIVKDFVWPELRTALEKDSAAYTGRGRALAEAWHRGLGRFEFPANLHGLHTWSIAHRSAVLFYAFGYSRLLPESMNVVLSASCALAGYVIMRRWADASAARIAALLIAFWPSAMVWSTTNLKDPIEMAALSWSVCGLLLLRDRFRVLPVLFVALSWFAAFLFRPYMGVMIIGGELAAIGFVAIKSRTFLASACAVALTAATSVLAGFATVHEANSIYGEGTANVDTWEQSRQAFHERATQDRERGVAHSEYVINLRANSKTEALLQLPLRIPLYLVNPIPVRLGSWLLMSTYPEMLLWYCLLPSLLRGVRLMWRRDWGETVLVVSSLAPMLIAFSISDSIAGATVRYRDNFLPELFLFVAVGWWLQHARRRQAEGLGALPPEVMAQSPSRDAA